MNILEIKKKTTEILLYKKFEPL